MKHHYLLLTVSLIYLNLSAQVSETQMALVNPKTATWCPPSGEWGIGTTENMVDENLDKAVFIELHNSDLLSNSFNDEILIDFPYASYTPAWYVNGKDVTAITGTGGIYPTITEDNVEHVVDSTYMVSPLANSSYNFSIAGDVLTVETQTKFFQTADGEFYLAVYAVEDNVEEYQNSAPEGYTHDYTLRTGMTDDNTYGVMIASGAIAPGTEYSETFTVTLDEEWIKSNIWVATVIWEKTGSVYEYVNAYTNYERIAVGIHDNDLLQLNTSILSNPVYDNTQLILNSDTYLNHVEVSLTDINGRIVKEIFNGSVSAGENSMNINVDGITAGIYFVKTIADNNQFINKLLIVK